MLLSSHNQVYLRNNSSAPQILRPASGSSSARVESDRPDPGTTERAMNQTVDIDHRPHGSVDLDFYRARAVALRGQSLQEAKRLRWGIGALAALAIVGLVASVAKPVVRVGGAVPPVMACGPAASAGAAANRCQLPAR